MTKKKETNTMETVTIDGIEYVPANSIPAPKPNGNRAVVVVDRGWIFAGDVTEENGRVKLSRAVWVFRWESVGFNGVLENPKSDKVTIKQVPDVDIPVGSEIFRVPVADTWGL